MPNHNLAKAKRAKNDEFYTQFGDIEAEISAYLEHDPDVFRGQVVYCNCDDPYESNFFRYFALNFNDLGLKSLITTSYSPSPIANTQLQLFGDDDSLPKSRTKATGATANKFVINKVTQRLNGKLSLSDIAKQLKENKNNEWTPLDGDGSFDSKECIDILEKEADIVVTNPPFSRFRKYINLLVRYNKKFLIIGHLNAVAYKEVFPLLKENKIWLGNNYKIKAGAMFFEIPKDLANMEQIHEVQEKENGEYKYITRVQGMRWFTNLEHGCRHEAMNLSTRDQLVKSITKKDFDEYDNYAAIEVAKVKQIPSDYDGVMGVPMSIFDKYSPDQFEILGADYDVKKGLLPELIKPNWTGKLDRGYLKGKRQFTRILIRHRKQA